MMTISFFSCSRLMKPKLKMLFQPWRHSHWQSFDPLLYLLGCALAGLGATHFQSMETRWGCGEPGSKDGDSRTKSRLRPLNKRFTDDVCFGAKAEDSTAKTEMSQSQQPTKSTIRSMTAPNLPPSQPASWAGVSRWTLRLKTHQQRREERIKWSGMTIPNSFTPCVSAQRP